MFENLGATETERRNVMIFDGKQESVNVKVPNEVPVYSSVVSGEIGRAVLREEEGKIYADIVLSKGSLKGFRAQPIGQRFPREYVVSAVGLVPVDAEIL